jgi:hypothetical protein
LQEYLTQTVTNITPLIFAEADYFYFIFRESLLRKMSESEEELPVGIENNKRARVRQLYISRTEMGNLYVVTPATST